MKRLSKYSLLILLIVGWILLSTCKIPTYILPSFFEVASSLWLFLQSKQALMNVMISFIRVLQAFVLASLCGGLLGMLCGRFAKIYRICNPVITLLKAIPGIGWLPLAIVWFGISDGKSIFLMSLAAFFPIYLSSFEGISKLPENYKRIAKLQSLTKFEEFVYILLPGGFPQIMVGLRNGMAICWAYLVLAEISGTNMGLGVLLNDARMLGKTNDIVMLMIVFAILGKGCDFMLLRISHYYKGGRI